jgi:hypothetical protein
MTEKEKFQQRQMTKFHPSIDLQEILKLSPEQRPTEEELYSELNEMLSAEPVEDDRDL